MIYRCKMCGGNLKIEAGSSVCTCESCGTKQTVPLADDEKKIKLFTRANNLLFACEFDRASTVYELIVADFPNEAEAYWGLVLCKYGIEYVDDPKTGKKVSTCHRFSFDSVFDDDNYKSALEKSDTVAREVYTDEAEEIEELRGDIIKHIANEEPYDIFICYKELDKNEKRTDDSVMAQKIYEELVREGYRVFFSRVTLKDKLGTDYEPYIFAALNTSRVMIVLGTKPEYFDAVWVKNEWSRYLKLISAGENKKLIPCVKGININDMPPELVRLQAQNMSESTAIQDIISNIEKIIPKRTDDSENFRGKKAKLISKWVIITPSLLVLIIGIVLVFTRISNNSKQFTKKEVESKDGIEIETEDFYAYGSEGMVSTKSGKITHTKDYTPDVEAIAVSFPDSDPNYERNGEIEFLQASRTYNDIFNIEWENAFSVELDSFLSVCIKPTVNFGTNLDDYIKDSYTYQYLVDTKCEYGLDGSTAFLGDDTINNNFSVIAWGMDPYPIVMGYYVGPMIKKDGKYTIPMTRCKHQVTEMLKEDIDDRNWWSTFDSEKIKYNQYY